jgi:hypothetical protein
LKEEDIDLYSDSDNPKEKKVVNKLIDYTLGKRD